MNKKIILKVFVLVFGIFVLSGCSFNPFSSSSRAPLAVPIENIPAEDVLAGRTPEEKALIESGIEVPDIIEPSFFGKFIREYKKGSEYQIDSPADYFVEEPRVGIIACEFKIECPCIIGDGYVDQKDFCQRIATSSRQVINGKEYCVQEWGEGAAGSLYTSYAYTSAISDMPYNCLSLQFTKRSVTSCSVYEGDDENVKNCEAEEAIIPVIIKRVVSSFTFTQP